MKGKTEVQIKEKIDSYIDGKLNEQEIEELWGVLIEHGEYYDYMKTAANLKAINTSANTAATIRFLRKPAYAAAAVLILLITVFSVFKFMNTPSAASVQAIASIELPFQRSVDRSSPDIIREAVLLNYNNKFEEAIDLLKNERSKTEDNTYKTRLNIMLGTLYYNKAKFKEAKKYFVEVTSSKGKIKPLQLEKAYWYLANTWLELAEFDKAKSAVQQVIKIDGAYSRVARHYLKALQNR